MHSLHALMATGDCWYCIVLPAGENDSVWHGEQAALPGAALNFPASHATHAPPSGPVPVDTVPHSTCPMITASSKMMGEGEVFDPARVQDLTRLPANTLRLVAVA